MAHHCAQPPLASISFPTAFDSTKYPIPCRASNKANQSCQGFRKYPKASNNPNLGSKKYFIVGQNISFYLPKIYNE
jgi:hypothetical protein